MSTIFDILLVFYVNYGLSILPDDTSTDEFHFILFIIFFLSANSDVGKCL